MDDGLTEDLAQKFLRPRLLIETIDSGGNLSKEQDDEQSSRIVLLVTESVSCGRAKIKEFSLEFALTNEHSGTIFPWKDLSTSDGFIIVEKTDW